jgi:phenylpropionate dioxygenase-like ring-hydroxylating dioxygenase large terminal subunit
MRVGELRFLRNYWYPVLVAEGWHGPRAITLFGRRYVLDPGGGDLPVRVRYGLVWTCVGDPVTSDPPAWPEADTAAQTGWRTYVEFFEPWACSAPRIIDNNLDNAHVAYVHRSTFGDPAFARLPRPTIRPNAEGGFTAVVTTRQVGVGVQLGVTDDEATVFVRDTISELVAPLTTRIRLRYHGAGPDYGFYGVATPVDDTSSIYVRLTALGGTPDEQPWERFHAFGTRVKEEDRTILETTDPDFPLDLTSEVHLKVDAPTVAYRRHLARLLQEDVQPCS